MPTRLAQSRPRPGARASLAQTLRAETHEELIRGPWPGYIPDIEPSMLPYSAMVGSSFGLVARGGVLVPDVGWSRVDAARLPLGDDGAGVGTVPATRAQWVSHLGFFNRQPNTDNEIIAITRDAGGAGEVSNVFRLPGSVNWSVIPPRNGYAAPTFTPWSLDADDFVDNATLATGFTQTTAGKYAGAAGRGVVGQPVFFFVNENNNVACWPCFRAGIVTEYDYPIEAIGTLTGFKAATCAALEGRMCYGDVTYGGNRFPQRMWHSAIGDGAAVDTGVIGAGFVDAPEMGGKLLRLLRLGDGLVGYFETGGIVVYTRTYNPLSPFNPPQYLTTQVAALSKRSVCAIDRDRHMIIAEQGWYMLDSSGLTELGLVTQGTTSMRKWLDTFYANVNITNSAHISIAYDSTHHLVEISFPSADSDVADTTWLYDTLADRVFPTAAYGAQAIHSQLVAPSVLDPALTWGAAVGTWGAFPGSWAAYSARLGFQSRYHGDRAGYVYVRDESQGFARQDTAGGNIQPGYSFVSPQRAVIAPAEWAEAHRFEVEYVNVGSPDATLTVTVDAQSAAGAANLQVAAAGKAGVAFLPVVALGGTHHGLAVTGTAPVALRGMRYVVVPTKGEWKGTL